MEIGIILDKFNKIYNLGETIIGSLNISNQEKILEYKEINLNLIVNFKIIYF